MFPNKINNFPGGEIFNHTGFSIIELLIVIAIIGILFSIARPSQNTFQEQRNFNRAKQDILAIQKSIDHFHTINKRFPNSLEEIGLDRLTDPWGTPYHYQVVGFDDKQQAENGVRRDKNLTPVNSDFDLYSAGKNKSTESPFTAKQSLDDIVRCDNGKYIGYADDY